MNYLDRNTLPRYQERLDLAASELNDMEDIFTKAINELAGRVYIVSAMIPEEDRSKYSDELSYPILTKINSLQTQIDSIREDVQGIQSFLTTINDKYLELEARLNTLDDVAARKADLNVLLWRSSEQD